MTGMSICRRAVERGGLVLALLLLAACAPAAPSPTVGSAPSAPAPTEAPKSAPQPATSPVPAAQPAASPAPAAPGAAPASSPVAAPAAKPAAPLDVKAVEEFYRGKTIRIVVGSAAGGGYDAYSRLIARHIGKYIPGNPTVIVENMPGAGFIIAANHVYSAAPSDGTVIGNVAIGAMAQQILGKPGVQFEAARFHYLGVPTTDTDLCVATRASGFKSLAETIGPGAKEWVAGGGAPGQTIEDEPRVLKEALGANIKIVSGYDGTSKARLAMDQGEVQGQCGWSWESVQATAGDRVQSGEYVIISQNSVERPHKDLPSVPVAYQLAKTDEARQLIRYGIILTNFVQREYVVAPGVPAERVQALRQAFAGVFTDSEFRADADKAKLTLDPVSGEEAQRLVLELSSMPAPIQEKLKEIWK